MQNISTYQLITAACVGLITIFGTARVLRELSTFGWASYPIAVCAGLLAFVGLAGMGKAWTGLLLPWMALGLAFVVLLLFRFVSRFATGRAPPEGNPTPKKKKPGKPPKRQPVPVGPVPHHFNPPIGALLTGNENDVPNSR